MYTPVPRMPMVAVLALSCIGRLAAKTDRILPVRSRSPVSTDESACAVSSVTLLSPRRMKALVPTAYTISLALPVSIVERPPTFVSSVAGFPSTMTLPAIR